MSTHINKSDVIKVLKINMAYKGYNILSECQSNATELVEEAIKRKQEECVKDSRKKSKIGVNPDDFTLEQEILESSGEFDIDFERLEKCSKYDLKQMCKEYNLSQSGHKTDLVERIAEYLHDQRGFNARISSVYNSVRSSVNNADSGESAALKEDEVLLLNKLMEEEEHENEKVKENENNKDEIVIEEPPKKHIQSPSPLHRPIHKAIAVLKNQDIQIESPIVEKPLKSVKPKLDMEEIESNIEETVDESELKRKIKLELEKRKVTDYKSKEINTPKTVITPRTPKPNPNSKPTIKYVNPIISKLKNTVPIAKATPIHSSHKQLPTNSTTINNNNNPKQEKPIQLIHPISTPILNHKCSKVFVVNNNNNNKPDDKKKVNINTKAITNNNHNNNDNNNQNNHNNNENENKENNCVENKKTIENNDKKKCNNNNNNKSNQEDWTSGEELQKQLKYQYDHYIDLECIFGKVKMFIFPNCQETLRGSSGDWRNDGLTDEEREEYRREVELEKML